MLRPALQSDAKLDSPHTLNPISIDELAVTYRAVGVLTTNPATDPMGMPTAGVMSMDRAVARTCVAAPETITLCPLSQPPNLSPTGETDRFSLPEAQNA